MFLSLISSQFILFHIILGDFLGDFSIISIFAKNIIMLYTKHTINATLHPQSKKGKQFIRIRVSSLSARIDLYTGISINNSQWDRKKQQVKQGYVINNTTYNIINRTLEEYKSFIRNYFDECAMRDSRPSLTELKERFNKKYKMSGKAQSDEFFYLFDKYIEEKSKERGWGKDMKDVYSRLRMKIFTFQPNIKFSDLSISTMNHLLEYMSQTMYNDALSRMLTLFKSFVKWAQGRKYAINEEFFTFKPKLPKAKKDVRYLELDEINKIYEMDFPIDSALDRIRDMFIFQCYTALRFSDIKQLKHENIHFHTLNNTFSIDLLTEKDDDRINFPLSKRATAIYLKYKDRKYINGLVFPVISNQKYNDHLKELGKRANLQGEWIDYEYRLSEKILVKTPKENLSTHTARRTFIVTALNENVDITLIALITSHSDLKSMRPYITKNAKGAARVIAALDEADRKSKEKE